MAGNRARVRVKFVPCWLWCRFAFMQSPRSEVSRAARSSLWMLVRPYYTRYESEVRIRNTHQLCRRRAVGFAPLILRVLIVVCLPSLTFLVIVFSPQLEHHVLSDRSHEKNVSFRNTCRIRWRRMRQEKSVRCIEGARSLVKAASSARLEKSKSVLLLFQYPVVDCTEALTLVLSSS